jgi:hypothetical protein
MKKKFIVLFAFFFWLFVQNILSQKENDPGVALIVACFNDHVTNNEDLKFILALKNNTGKPIQIPEEINAVPINSLGGDVLYEIYYCTKKDTINVLDSVITQNQRSGVLHDFVSLNSENIYYFSPHVSKNRFFFPKSGIYRIRFIFSADRVKPNLLKDIKTDWIFFNFTRNN